MQPSLELYGSRELLLDEYYAALLT
jgi:hypothetical protein